MKSIQYLLTLLVFLLFIQFSEIVNAQVNNNLFAYDIEQKNDDNNDALDHLESQVSVSIESRNQDSTSQPSKLFQYQAELFVRGPPQINT